MSNLLKDASILLTPTAYENGRMNAIKPYKDLYGPELVTNGDFATDSDWSKGTGWSIENGQAICNGVGINSLQQGVATTTGKTYKLTFDVLDSNNFDFLVISTNFGDTYVDANLNNSVVIGRNTFYIQPTNGTGIRFRVANGTTLTVDNVSVVEDLSGDFQFSRNSAATRVNAQGLVENVQIISDELVSNGNFSQIGTEEVSNGDFSQIGAEEVSNGNFSQEGSELVINGDFATDSDWTKQAGWTISGGTANFVEAGGNRNIYQSILTVGKTYKLTYTVSNYVSGGIRNISGPYVTRTANGTYTEIFTTTTYDRLFLNCLAGSQLSIDNVSVKEVGQDWSLLNAELTNNGVIIGQADGSISQFGQFGVFTIGKQYKLTYDILEDNGGVFSLAAPSTILTTTLGSHTIYLTASSADLFIKRSSASTTTKTTFTNVSVKEVGQDWDFGTGWSMGDGVAIATSGASTKLIQSISGLSGKTCKVSFTLSDYGGNGSVRVDFGSVSTDPINTNGEHIVYGTYDINAFELFKNTGFEGSVTNISVKEVGQDWTLGTGWSVDQANSRAEAIDAPFGSQLIDVTTLVASKKYRVSFDISNYIQGSVRVAVGNVFSSDVSSNGSYTFILTTSNTNAFKVQARSGGSGTTLSISNISVKEITDDTDLPRINYEGFSYQDSLGSEEVVNGNWYSYRGADFTINNNLIYIENVGNTYGGIEQSFVVTANKIFKLKYNVTQGTTSTDWRVDIGSTQGASDLYSKGQVSDFTENTTITSNSNQIWIRIYNNTPTIGDNFSIDNVSVKEYFGQEVVPDSGCGSWLLEPQSTNLVTDSQNYNGTYWSGQRGVLSDGGVGLFYLSPNSNVIKYEVNQTQYNQMYYRLPSGVTIGNTYTQQGYVKCNDAPYIHFQISTLSGNPTIVWDNVNNTLISADSSIDSYNITSLNDGWVKAEITYTASVSSIYASLKTYFSTSSTTNWAGVPVGTIAYQTFVQVEQQSYATSYIPTNGATNTRLQDIASNSGNSTLINSTEGVLYAEVDFSPQDNRSIVIKSNTSDRLSISSRPNNGVRFFISDSGGLKYNDYSNALIDGFNKIALSWDADGFYGFVNGSKIHNISTAINLQGLNQVSFESGLDDFYGKNKALAVYKETKTDANLRCLTYPNPVATTFDLDFDTIAEQFTFTRGSEATFVNEQGLIESTNQIGPELVVNGDFSNGSANWENYTSGSSTIVFTDVATLNVDASNSNVGIYQENVFASGKQYKVVLRIKASSSFDAEVLETQGAATVSTIGSVSLTTSYQDFTFYFTGTGTNDIFIHRKYGSSSANQSITIDNVSVKEVISATNTPRIDYSTGEKAFLLEPQSTNLSAKSQNIGGWSFPVNVTTTQDYGTSPDGSVNSTRLQFTANGFMNDGLTLTNGTEYTLSVYAKRNDTETQSFGFYVNGNPTIVGGITLTDEWQRFTYTYTASSNSSIGLAGNSGADVSVFGFQAEQQSYATSYIPTDGASATRNQELCNNATPVINSEEGTLYAEISALDDDGNDGYISLSNGTLSNYVYLRTTGSLNQVKIGVVKGGVTQASRSETLSDITQFNKLAISYSQDLFKFYVNGTLIFTDTNGDTFSAGTLDRLNFDIGTNNFNKFFGNTKGLKYYPKALADVQLEDLTTI